MTAVLDGLEEMAAMARPADNVIAALARVMKELPGIGKDGTGPKAQGSYKYRGIEQITREVQPLLAKHGVVIVPNVMTWVRDEIPSDGKVWTDDRLTVGYTIYGPGGLEDKIEVSVPGVGRDNSDKGTNKALTQAFKYLLLQVFCISDDNDDGDSSHQDRDEGPVSFGSDRSGQIRARIREIGKPASDWLNKEGPKAPWSDADCDLIEAKFAELS